MSLLSYFRRIFGKRRKRNLVISDAAYERQVKRCIASAEAKTGHKCSGLLRVEVVKSSDIKRSKSLGMNVAVLEGTNNCGAWMPGTIWFAVRPDGYVPDEVIEHEVAHQIAWDAGLDRANIVHCPEFRGRVWGWTVG